MTTAFDDECHRLFADPIVIALSVEPLSPAQRRDIAILMHSFVRDEVELFADRSPCVWIGAMIQEKPRQGSIPLPPT